MNNTTVIALSIVGLVLLLRFWLSKRQRNAQLPPGPRGLPIIGNLKDLPTEDDADWEFWLKHKDLYGPISSVTVPGQTIVILNEAHDAEMLLEKRALIYSARGHLTFAGDMVGWDDTPVFQSFTPLLRAYRKVIHQFIGTKNWVARFENIQEEVVGRFLLDLLNDPNNVAQHLRRSAGAIILKMTYGYNIQRDGEDPLVSLVELANRQLFQAMRPGRWIVDTLPFLRHVPEWMPGAEFKRTARLWRKTVVDVNDKPYNFVKYRMKCGQNEKSYLSDLLSAHGREPTPDEAHIAKVTAGALYGAGADTTVATLSIFFLAMLVYPEVQIKAQEEIDRVVGQDRLPTFEDREKLVYIDAIIKESLRWHTAVPTGIPHAVDKDDYYKGYFIPKGAIVIPNAWAFAHDARTYHEPMVFKPERYFASDGREPEPDPATFVFGHGRRICPGRILAEAAVYITIAQSLAAFSISKPFVNGKVVEPEIEFTHEVLSFPRPFKMDAKPRSPGHEKLIRAAQTNFTDEESDAKVLQSMTTVD